MIAPEDKGRAIPHPRSFRAAAVLPWIAVLLPAAFYLAQLDHFGRLQYDDYYALLPRMMEGARFTHDPLRWLTLRSNEHGVALPALVFAANVRATSGDNRALSAIAVVLLAAVSGLLLRALPHALTGGDAERIAWAVLVGGLILSPAGSYSIVAGFSGVMWFMSLAFSVAAIVLLRKGCESRSILPMAGVVAAGWAAALSYGTALFLWPALVAGALMYRAPRRRLAALLIGAAIPYAFAVATYARPPQHPGIQAAKPWLLVEFFAVYLGSFLQANPWAAGATGLAGLAVAALLALRAFPRLGSEDVKELAPWLMTGLFALGIAAGTALARAAMGGARSSRYAPVAALFWVSLGVVASAMVRPGPERRGPARRLVRPATLLVVLAAVAATWWRGLPVLAGWLERASWQVPAEVALVRGVDDPAVLEAVSIAPQQVFDARDTLARLGHLPFNRPQPLPASPLLAATAAPCPGVRGRLTAVHAIDGSTFRVEGALDGDAPADPDLPILDARGELRGLLRVIPPRNLPARFGVAAAGEARLAGYVRPSGPDGPLRVFAPGPRAGGGGCAISDPWRVSDAWPQPSGVTAWRRPAGLRPSAP